MINRAHTHAPKCGALARWRHASFLAASARTRAQKQQRRRQFDLDESARPSRKVANSFFGSLGAPHTHIPAARARTGCPSHSSSSSSKTRRQIKLSSCALVAAAAAAAVDANAPRQMFLQPARAQHKHERRRRSGNNFNAK